MGYRWSGRLCWAQLSSLFGDLLPSRSRSSHRQPWRPRLRLGPLPTPGPLRVDVVGAVVSPGIYTHRGSLVADAVAAAGGGASDADLDRINKAMPLQDSMQVFVPRVAQAIPTVINPPASTTPAWLGQTAVPGKQVNLNTASLDELDTLPGVGPATGQRIVEGRPYGAIEESDARQGDRAGDIR